MFSKIGALKNFAKFPGKHLCWNYFLINYRPGGLGFYSKETPTQVLSCEYCKIFKKTYFEEHLRTAASALLIINLVIIIGSSLVNQKHNLGWFLLRRFVDLVRIYSLLIISRNHSNRFLLLDLQKNGSKQKLSKQVETDYCPLL